ncbi:MAG: tetratricopeptide repeat protein [Litorimonas sp.]
MFGTFTSLSLLSAAPAFAQSGKAPVTQGLTNPVTSNLPTQSLINPDEKLANIEAAIRAYKAGQFAQASSLAKTAYNAGSMDGAVLLGHIDRKGELGTVNYSSARQWYEKAARLSHLDALMALANMGVNEQGGLTKTDAAGYLSRAADRGRVEAMVALSDLYRTGDGVAQSDERSREYLTRAAESFDIEANKKLGDSYFKTDPKKALGYYEAAANAGHIEASYIAGVMYAENFNIRPNSQRSAQLLHQAARGGHAAAQADYGLLVYQGYGAKQSDEGAADWFRKSAEGGDSEGQFLYAFTLAKGEGIAQDYEEAYYWILQSTNNGVDDYDKDRQELRKRLEDNVDPDVLARAKARIGQ